MDRHAAWLDRRVAEAAEAWLTDPRDTGVYTRLVRAIIERRAYLNPQLPAGEQADAALDEFADLRPGLRLGEVFAGDPPSVVLSRLRSAAPDRQI